MSPGPEERAVQPEAEEVVDAEVVSEPEPEGAAEAAPEGSSGEPVSEARVADEAAGASVEQDLNALIEEARTQRDEYLQLAQRTKADFDNYRKRMATQQADEVQRATGKMAEALLPVLDACEAAFVQHPAEVEPVFNLLLGELRKLGLEGMNLLEQPFDPNLAEAVMHEPGDGAETVVSEVLRSGYTWQGRVLRAAMVKVRG